MVFESPYRAPWRSRQGRFLLRNHREKRTAAPRLNAPARAVSVPRDLSNHALTTMLPHLRTARREGHSETQGQGRKKSRGSHGARRFQSEGLTPTPAEGIGQKALTNNRTINGPTVNARWFPGLWAVVPAIVGGKLTSDVNSLRHAAASRRRPVDVQSPTDQPTSTRIDGPDRALAVAAAYAAQSLPWRGHVRRDFLESSDKLKL
jgi:hypothetical protein